MDPLDFFLWSYMKSLIHETPVESEMDIVAKIVVAVVMIVENPRIFEHIRQSILKRYQTCIDIPEKLVS